MGRTGSGRDLQAKLAHFPTGEGEEGRAEHAPPPGDVGLWGPLCLVTLPLVTRCPVYW